MTILILLEYCFVQIPISVIFDSRENTEGGDKHHSSVGKLRSILTLDREGFEYTATISELK
jgi:hypothetical protein